MITVICDRCKRFINFGYACKYGYLGDDPQERLAWDMRNDGKEPSKHLCMNCLEDTLLIQKSNARK